jgi:hypothetical protein
MMTQEQFDQTRLDRQILADALELLQAATSQRTHLRAAADAVLAEAGWTVELLTQVYVSPALMAGPHRG